jgi:Leu/Phe-tRNA-protein transferase
MIMLDPAMIPALPRTPSGHVIISPGDDPDLIVDTLIRTNYKEEFCVSPSFDPFFTARLMAAGFLVMSMELDGSFILLPKLHLERSVIFFPGLHEPGSARRLIPRYELRQDSDFDPILDHCIETHGDDWLTPPLAKSFRLLWKDPAQETVSRARLACFGLYRQGELRAGEFGVIAGKVYTSYSGWYDEDSAGTVQMLLTGRRLRDLGFAFWDLGMPMEYKARLGAQNIERKRFLELFRNARV